MQDAFMGNWARESHLPAGHAGSLRDLNHRFLDLAGALPAQLAPLSAPQRAAAADCPYALFDLRFNDALHWRARLLLLDGRRVADSALDEIVASDVTAETSSFVQLALFYAWHVAVNARLTAQLVLGMRAETAAAFSRITVNDLPGLVTTEAIHLTPRWSNCAVYWRALTGAALNADPTALRRAQLYGLQLAAAGRLPVT